MTFKNQAKRIQRWWRIQSAKVEAYDYYSSEEDDFAAVVKFRLNGNWAPSFPKYKERRTRMAVAKKTGQEYVETDDEDGFDL